MQSNDIKAIVHCGLVKLSLVTRGPVKRCSYTDGWSQNKFENLIIPQIELRQVFSTINDGILALEIHLGSRAM